MKTIIVFINSMSQPGGIERVVANLLKVWKDHYIIKLLVKDEVDQSFYEIPTNIQGASINIPLKLDMKNRKSRVLAILNNIIRSHKRLKKYLADNEYDYIYTTTPLNSLEVYMASPKNRKKIIISEHASAFAVNKIYSLIKRFVYPKAGCISVPNKMDCNVYENWGCKTFYVPHLCTFKVENRNSLDTKIALNVGRYTADKRQAELVKIWSNVPKKQGWQLWIVGKGEEEENLREIITELNLENSVKLVPPSSDIASIYKKASLFLFSSWKEGFGMVILEAMSFGIPCISYDCPSGPRDLIENNVNGILIENNNQSMFSTSIEKIINDDNALQCMGENAFNTVKNWDNDGIIKKWAKIFSL